MSKKSGATANAPMDAPFKRQNQRSENFEIEPTAVDVLYMEPDALDSE